MTIEKYQPSNGTAGLGFIERWCGNCSRDKCLNGSKQFEDCADEEVCDIVARTMAYKVTDPEYPVEWQYKDGKPVCTAFVQKGEPVPVPRCEKTIDMFGEAPQP